MGDGTLKVEQSVTSSFGKVTVKINKNNTKKSFSDFNYLVNK